MIATNGTLDWTTKVSVRLGARKEYHTHASGVTPEPHTETSGPFPPRETRPFVTTPDRLSKDTSSGIGLAHEFSALLHRTVKSNSEVSVTSDPMAKKVVATLFGTLKNVCVEPDVVVGKHCAEVAQFARLLSGRTECAAVNPPNAELDTVATQEPSERLGKL